MSIWLIIFVVKFKFDDCYAITLYFIITYIFFALYFYLPFGQDVHVGNKLVINQSISLSRGMMTVELIYARAGYWADSRAISGQRRRALWRDRVSTSVPALPRVAPVILSSPLSLSLSCVCQRLAVCVRVSRLENRVFRASSSTFCRILENTKPC